MIASVASFAVSGAVVFLAAVLLAYCGDAIAERTKLGRLWVGSLLVAGATSLPELATDVAAVRMGATDLAIGDLFGSSMANMALLAVVDLIPPRDQVLRRATLDHALSAALAIGLNVLAALFVLAPMRANLGRVGLEPIILLGMYVLGMRVVFRHSMRPRDLALTASPEAPAAPEHGPSLRRAIAGFALASLVILAAAPFFARAAKQIAEESGLGLTFVGTLLVGLSTSLPELVSSVAAVRMKAYDLAVGNLIGSCAFNMSIFFALDLATPTPIFVGLPPVHALTALTAVLLLSLGLAAIVFRAERRFALIEPSSVLMLATYLLGLLLVYTQVGTS